VEEKQLRILVLIADAFGGQGGIAKFNRDLLTAMCSHLDCTEVVAMPRLMPNPTGPLPSRLIYVTEGLGDKLRYVFTGLKSLYRNAKQPTRHGLTNHLARRVDALIAVSNFTMQRFLGWARGDLEGSVALPRALLFSRLARSPGTLHTDRERRCLPNFSGKAEK
jgi:hypothetical protein